jgi:hypothetical protein
MCTDDFRWRRDPKEKLPRDHIEHNGEYRKSSREKWGRIDVLATLKPL